MRFLENQSTEIGYGGYLKLALDFPEFIDYVESVCDEFRTLYENIKGTTPYCVEDSCSVEQLGQDESMGQPHGSPRFISKNRTILMQES